jgi:hypothetical protein
MYPSFGVYVTVLSAVGEREPLAGGEEIEN